jgi:hypothetical protein
MIKVAVAICFASMVFRCESQRTISVSSAASHQPEIDRQERLIDSTRIGVSKQFKIDIWQTRNSDNEETFAEFVFYRKEEDQWHRTQTFKTQKDGISPLDPVFSDFNNDGYNDLTFRSSTAARSANELRTLFIFDGKAGKLREIKNSNDYPNLEYNKQLNCIDAWLVYGGSSTVFFTLEADSLCEFAGVDILSDGSRTVYEIANKGKLILREDSAPQDEVYTRYKNYKPLEVAEQ